MAVARSIPQPRAQDAVEKPHASLIAATDEARNDPPTLKPLIAAEVAQLRYVNDRLPGITGLPAGDGFLYRDAEGRLIRSESELARFKGLRIPPAWTDGSAPIRPAISRPSAATSAGASNTSITRVGAPCATRRNSSTC